MSISILPTRTLATWCARRRTHLSARLIESRYGRQIAEIEQDVSASTLADETVAKALRLEPGASVLKIVRRYLDADGQTFEVTATVHPADSFSVSMRLKRSTS
ncbi:3-carboxy-cis,cis-muconate cycloisomerase PcaB [Cupriavidus necator N-1]|uniref:3-carboxy-cis,cis-muconate cycloisomerase PcaB n=1 Tax=Cupriavidus necator (strain ATCC 43291 / DSM 13513 / CCUG 52238 / LMG 8453 / N-1) TaxID=1042878 RepID=F8GQ36_CUPNN|nr:3-carboxy-cis,cis-muconate cycloisomerase PcaB [Cupriavidus necator N-1]